MVIVPTVTASSRLIVCATEACGKCSVLPQLHKDLGLIYCHSGDYKNGRVELLVAQKLSPGDEDVQKALRLLEPANKPQ